MPELPEVEVVRQELSQQLKSSTRIENLIFHRRDLRFPIPILKLKKKLVGQILVKIHRRGKYLLFETPQGFLLSHLGMSGTWRVQSIKNPERKKHDHVEVHLNTGVHLIFNDPRRFGICDFAEDIVDHPRLKGLGPEPWADEFSVAELLKKFRGTNRNIKVALMDPKVVVGVGNIYASEILFLTGLSPLRKSHRVRPEELQNLVRNTRLILEEAIRRGGSTLKDFYRSDGAQGDFQNAHQVYDREGEDCIRCKKTIRRKVMVGRSTFWCSNCQK